MGDKKDLSFTENSAIEGLVAPKNLLDLPPEILIKVFEKMPYDSVAKARIVCRTFNNVCAEVLNLGFKKTIARHKAITKHIKSQLPRRESERRGHILARHSDVLHSIETRLSMLTLTYGKYIETNLCCFVPGRVLDEMNNVLNVIDMQGRIWRPHDVLQELRDISSMAIDHFDENMAGTLKNAYSKIMKSEEAPRALTYADTNKRLKKYKWGEWDNELKTLFSTTISPQSENPKVETMLFEKPTLVRNSQTPFFVTTSMLQNATSPITQLKSEIEALKTKVSALKQNEDTLRSEAKTIRSTLNKERKKMRQFELRLKKLELTNSELRSELLCLRRGAVTPKPIESTISTGMTFHDAEPMLKRPRTHDNFIDNKN